MVMRYGRVGSSPAKPQVGWHALGAVRVARSQSEQDTKGEIFKRIKVSPQRLPIPSESSKSLERLPIPSKSPKTPNPPKDFRSPQNPPKTPNPLKTLPIPSKSSNPAAPSRPRMITSRRRHPLFFFFGPPTRPTTHTPHNTRSRGVKNRGAPDQNHRFATGLARAYGFGVLRSSRQVGAGSRGRVTTDGSPTPHQNSLAPQNSGAPAQRRATQPRPCARADTTRPATANYPPVRKECLSRGFPSKEPPQQFHHTTICTSHHHIIAYYLACTDRPDGRRATRHLENRKPAATAATEETPNV